MGGHTIRFALAEALLQPELPATNPASFSNVAPLELPAIHDKDYEMDANRTYTAEELKG